MFGGDPIMKMAAGGSRRPRRKLCWNNSVAKEVYRCPLVGASGPMCCSVCPPLAVRFSQSSFGNLRSQRGDKPSKSLFEIWARWPEFPTSKLDAPCGD